MLQAQGDREGEHTWRSKGVKLLLQQHGTVGDSSCCQFRGSVFGANCDAKVAIGH